MLCLQSRTVRSQIHHPLLKQAAKLTWSGGASWLTGQKCRKEECIRPDCAIRIHLSVLETEAPLGACGWRIAGCSDAIIADCCPRSASGES
jgi:hypothetical protein